MNPENESLIADARLARKEGDTGKAIELLGYPTLKGNEEALFLMGEIHYSMQNWGKALNCFQHCLQINPDLAAARSYAELIRNILGFFHTDQFNP